MFAVNPNVLAAAAAQQAANATPAAEPAAKPTMTFGPGSATPVKGTENIRPHTPSNVLKTGGSTRLRVCRHATAVGHFMGLGRRWHSLVARPAPGSVGPRPWCSPAAMPQRRLPLLSLLSPLSSLLPLRSLGPHAARFLVACIFFGFRVSPPSHNP